MRNIPNVQSRIELGDTIKTIHILNVMYILILLLVLIVGIFGHKLFVLLCL